MRILFTNIFGIRKTTNYQITHVIYFAVYALWISFKWTQLLEFLWLEKHRCSLSDETLNIYLVLTHSFLWKDKQVCQVWEWTGVLISSLLVMCIIIMHWLCRHWNFYYMQQPKYFWDVTSFVFLWTRFRTKPYTDDEIKVLPCWTKVLSLAFLVTKHDNHI